MIVRLEYQTNPFPHCYPLGSVQVLCKTILTISAPHPLCKQNIYNLRSSTPSKMLTQYLNRDLFIHASSKFQVCSTPRSGRFWWEFFFLFLWQGEKKSTPCPAWTELLSLDWSLTVNFVDENSISNHFVFKSPVG